MARDDQSSLQVTVEVDKAQLARDVGEASQRIAPSGTGSRRKGTRAEVGDAPPPVVHRFTPYYAPGTKLDRPVVQDDEGDADPAAAGMPPAAAGHGGAGLGAPSAVPPDTYEAKVSRLQELNAQFAKADKFRSKLHREHLRKTAPPEPVPPVAPIIPPEPIVVTRHFPMGGPRADDWNPQQSFAAESPAADGGAPSPAPSVRYFTSAGQASAAFGKELGVPSYMLQAQQHGSIPTQQHGTIPTPPTLGQRILAHPLIGMAASPFQSAYAAGQVAYHSGATGSDVWKAMGAGFVDPVRKAFAGSNIGAAGQAAYHAGGSTSDVLKAMGGSAWGSVRNVGGAVWDAVRGRYSGTGFDAIGGFVAKSREVLSGGKSPKPQTGKAWGAGEWKWNDATKDWAWTSSGGSGGSGGSKGGKGGKGSGKKKPGRKKPDPIQRLTKAIEANTAQVKGFGRTVAGTAIGYALGSSLFGFLDQAAQHYISHAGALRQLSQMYREFGSDAISVGHKIGYVTEESVRLTNALGKEKGQVTEAAFRQYAGFARFTGMEDTEAAGTVGKVSRLSGGTFFRADQGQRTAAMFQLGMTEAQTQEQSTSLGLMAIRRMLARLGYVGGRQQEGYQQLAGLAEQQFNAMGTTTAEGALFAMQLPNMVFGDVERARGEAGAGFIQSAGRMFGGQSSNAMRIFMARALNFGTKEGPGLVEFEKLMEEGAFSPRLASAFFNRATGQTRSKDDLFAMLWSDAKSAGMNASGLEKFLEFGMAPENREFLTAASAHPEIVKPKVFNEMFTGGSVSPDKALAAFKTGGIGAVGELLTNEADRRKVGLEQIKEPLGEKVTAAMNNLTGAAQALGSLFDKMLKFATGKGFGDLLTFITEKIESWARALDKFMDPANTKMWAKEGIAPLLRDAVAEGFRMVITEAGPSMKMGLSSVFGAPPTWGPPPDFVGPPLPANWTPGAGGGSR